MKMKKILFLMIFSFCMFLPFDVKAYNTTVSLDTNFSYVLRDTDLLSKSDIDFIDNLVSTKFSGSSNMNYFVVYTSTTNSYRVYCAPGDLYFMPSIGSNNALDFRVPFQYSFDVNLETNQVGTLSSLNYPSYQSMFSISPGVYKNGKFYTFAEAVDEFGFDRTIPSTLKDFKLVMPIVYANSEFVVAVEPRQSSIPYSDLVEYSNWNYPNKNYLDFPRLNSDSNFNLNVGQTINLTPAIEDTDFTNDVTVSYVYDGKDNNTIQIDVLIGEKPYSCFNGSMTFGDNVCLNRKNYDYFDFFISVEGNISAKIYTSKDNKNFVKSPTTFSKVDGGFQLSKPTLGTYTNKYKSYKFVITLTEDQVATLRIKYNSKYLTVNLPPQVFPDKYYTEYDMTGKYAIGLIPKSNKSLSTIKYLGDFVTYYKVGSEIFAYKYDKFSSENYIVKNIDFSPFSGQSNVIFYIMNNKYTDLQSVSKIKYLSNYFELLYFEEPTSLVAYDGFNYSAPDSNIPIKSYYSDFSSGTSSSNNSSSGDFSLGNIFSQLPQMIIGLGSAFGAVGTCIVIAFSSLPELVQSVLTFSLIITILVVAIKLLKG